MNQFVHACALTCALVSLAAVGCGEAGQPSSQQESLLSEAETAALAEKTARSTLAEISVPHGKMRFIETEPGSVLILRDFPIGARVETLPRESELSVEQIYRGYTQEPMPAALAKAIERMKAGAAPEPGALAEVLGAARSGQAVPTTAQSDGEAVKRLQLASSIDENWFKANFCGFMGPSHQWCHKQAFMGGNATGKMHRSDIQICGDTGAARIILRISGADAAMGNVLYGSCIGGQYHGPHDIFGSALTRTLEWNIVWAEQTVRFGGWFASGEQFIHKL